MPREKTTEIKEQTPESNPVEPQVSDYDLLQYEVELKKLELQLIQLDRLILEERSKIEEVINQSKKRTLKTS